MKATWKNNSVEFIQWKGDNLKEIEDFVGKDHKIFIAADGSNEIYIRGIGIAIKTDYLYKNGNYIYSPITISSWKMFPRLVNEDIGSGLPI